MKDSTKNSKVFFGSISLAQRQRPQTQLILDYRPTSAVVTDGRNQLVGQRERGLLNANCTKDTLIQYA